MNKLTVDGNIGPLHPAPPKKPQKNDDCNIELESKG